MENSDFSDGITHWHGNGKTAESEMTTDFASGSTANAKGMVVELRSSNWTKVTQEIHGYAGKNDPPRNLVLTIQYQTSPDFALSTRASDYANVGASIEFGSANLFERMGAILAFVDMPPPSRMNLTSTANNVNTYTVYPDLVSSASFVPATGAQVQTFSAAMHPPSATQDDYPTFCIAFPPGTGSVTITKISLAPGTAPDNSEAGASDPGPNATP
jgi:hypothetical protein